MHATTVVRYIGEKGIDSDGARREFYHSFFEEICLPQYGMFDPCPDQKCFFPSLDSSRAQNLSEQFFLFGKIIAKALIDGEAIGEKFPICLYKYLVDQQDSIDLSDVFLLDKELYGNLQMLLMQSVDDWDLKWDLDYNPGNYTKITDNNKDVYIINKARSILIDQRKQALDEIHRGFHSLNTMTTHLSLFSPVELRLLLSGEVYIDGEMVLHQFQFDSRWKDSSIAPTKEYLSDWIRSAPSDHLKLLLLLTTGSPTIPIGGFNPPITVCYEEDYAKLPEGQTCVNMLLLPKYDSMEQLAKALCLALENLESSGTQIS